MEGDGQRLHAGMGFKITFCASICCGQHVGRESRAKAEGGTLDLFEKGY